MVMICSSLFPLVEQAQRFTLEMEQRERERERARERRGKSTYYSLSAVLVQPKQSELLTDIICVE